MNTRIWSLAAVCALALGTRTVHADPASAARQKAGEAREHAAEARDKAREARAHAAAAHSAGDTEEAKKAHEAAKDAHEAAKEAHQAAKEARGDAGLAPDELRKHRRERRQQRRAELRQKWGDALLMHPAVRAELKTHAWRLARLHRVRSLADAAGKKDVVARVDTLITKEQARHDKRMATLKEKRGEE